MRCLWKEEGHIISIFKTSVLEHLPERSISVPKLYLPLHDYCRTQLMYSISWEILTSASYAATVYTLGTTIYLALCTLDNSILYALLLTITISIDK